MRLHKQRKIGMLIVIPALTLLLGACGTTHQPPLAKIAAAELAIRQAEESNARDHAALELRYARDKLQSAKTAVESGDDDRFPLAEQQADAALADARLAEAKARAARAEKIERDMQKSLEALRQEGAR